MRLIRGIDGCPAGWVAISKDLDTSAISWQLFPTAHDLFYTEPRPEISAIDIPIGLTDLGPRACDLEARGLLGPGRASSVFPAPIRPVLKAAGYEEACQTRFDIERKKLSRQAWAIVPKIREVDEALRGDAALQAQVREVHPEVSFFFLAGHPLRYGKKTKSGREERRQLLEPVFGAAVQQALADRTRLGSGEDDVLDAFAALWTAERVLEGRATCVPAAPPRDSYGLFMGIAA